MSQKLFKVIEGLRELLKKPERVFPVTVTSIHKPNCTIDAKTVEGLELFDIKLRAVADTKTGYIIYPKKDTTVQICRTGDEDDYLMLHADEVESMELIIEGVKYKVDKQGYVVSKGNDNLKDVIQLIIDAQNLTIEATQQILVIYGNNPDFAKLVQATTKTTQAQTKKNNLLK